MKFSVASVDLLKSLNIASGAIGTGSVVYILEDFLLGIEGNQMTISATNMETAITTRMDIQSSDSGRLAIRGKLLLDTLKALPAQPVTFDIDEDNRTAELQSAFGKYKMAFEKPEDFPAIPEPDGEDTFILPASVLLSAIANSLFAISNDEMRIAMTGLYTQIDFDKIVFVATDAHKLVRYTYNGIGSNFSSSFILPKKALNLLKSILPEKEDVSISFNRNFAFFSWGDTRVSCRLIEAQYPNYNVVIPVSNSNKMTVSREEFLNSLRRIAIFANKTTNQVVLSISDKSLTISTKDVDFANEAVEQLNCTYEGEPIVIGFNARFLIDMLNVLHNDEIIFELSKPSTAGLILPAEQEPQQDLLMLVMPVMIPNN